MERDYDSGFFKVLARNDTGETGSHQGGIVIPRNLAPYFPFLSRGVGPTSDREIVGELFDGPRYIDTVITRFQSQTWGGARPSEYRLTRNLRPLLKIARSGDVLVFERKFGTVDRFRIRLVRKGVPDYDSILRTDPKQIVVRPDDPPATQQDFERVDESIATALLKPFVPIEPDTKLKLTLVQRRVRTELFQTRLRSGYRNHCALCAVGLITPTGVPEIEAAHIIPRGENGTNDPRNGIALCCSHHWAFDRFLWTFSPERKVAIPKRVSEMGANASLVAFSGRPVGLPGDITLMPATEAIEHHRKRSVESWGAV